MHIEELRDYCLKLPGTSEGFPFDGETLVFKVLGKMFALCALENTPPTVSLKCDPELVPQIRAKYPAVSGAYHMNKKHWNGIVLDGSIGDDELKEWINHSYTLVVTKLPKKQQATLRR